jgi:hypothetical protein
MSFLKSIKATLYNKINEDQQANTAHSIAFARMKNEKEGLT